MSNIVSFTGIPATNTQDLRPTNTVKLSNGWYIVISNGLNDTMDVWRSVDKGVSFTKALNMKRAQYTGGYPYSYNPTCISARGNKVAFAFNSNHGGSSTGSATNVLYLDFDLIVLGATITDMAASPPAGVKLVQVYETYSSSAAGIYMASDNNVYLTYHTYYSSGGSDYYYWAWAPWNGSFTNNIVNGTSAAYGTTTTMVEFGGSLYLSWSAQDIYKAALGSVSYTVSTLVANGYSYSALLLVNPNDGLLYAIESSGKTLRKFNSAGNTWANILALTIQGNAFIGAEFKPNGDLHAFTFNSATGGAVYKSVYGNNGLNAPVNTTIFTPSAGDNSAPIQQLAPLTNYPNVNETLVSWYTKTAATAQNETIVVYSDTWNTAPNAPTITNPTASQKINTKTPTINWTFSDPDAGDTQSAFDIQLVNSAYSAVLFDSGWVAGSATSWTLPSNWITADGTYYVRMQVKDAAGVINTNNGNAPDTNFYNIQFVVDTVVPTIGSVSGQQYTKTNSATVWVYNVTDASGINGISVYALKPDSTYYLLGSATKNGATNDYFYNVTDITVNGNWRYDFDVYDNAGNHVVQSTNYVFRDTVVPTAPTQTNGTLYATSNGVSWTAFSDTAPSSGLNTTTMNFQIWNGSVWNNVATYPKNVTGTTYSFTGLTPATQYRWGVTYTDNAGNATGLVYTTFTTNTYTVTTINNLTSTGNTFSLTPKFKATVTDANDATLTDFQIQVSIISDFTSTILDTTEGAVTTGWSATSIASGGTIYYTPQANLSVGTRYVRMRAFDGKDWGTWSPTITFSINAVSWVTTISANDTAISKRTIDELRTKVNAVRQARGLAVANWTDPTIVDWNGGTPTNIRVAHLTELRQAIVDIYTALSITAPTWTDPTIDTTIARKGIHWTELRNTLVTV